MSEENISQECIPKNIEETRNYFIKEINQNEPMSKEHKKVCRVLDYIKHLLILDYIKHLLILIFTVTG